MLVLLLVSAFSLHFTKNINFVKQVKKMDYLIEGSQEGYTSLESRNLERGKLLVN